MANDLLMDEIAYQIVHNKQTVINILQSAGVNVPASPSNQKLASLTAKNIWNDKVSKGISDLIAKTNKEGMSAFSNANGAKGFFEKLSDTIKSIFTKKSDSEEELKNKVSEINKENSTGGGLKALLIVSGISAVAIGIGYWMVKSK
jgi:hypothetical protein